MAVTLFFSNKISINFWGMRDIITFCSFIDYGDHIDKISMKKDSSHANQIETARVNPYTLSLLHLFCLHRFLLYQTHRLFPLFCQNNP